MFRRNYVTYELHVEKVQNEYLVVFTRPSVRVGTGAILTGYDNQQDAEHAAMKFHHMYQQVQQVGMALDFTDEPSFVNTAGRSIPVRVALHMTERQLNDAIIALNR